MGKLKHSAYCMCIAVLFLLPPYVLVAQTGLNTEELNTATGTVDFENNFILPNILNTHDEIRQIGSVLGREINDSDGKKKHNVRVGIPDRYSLIEVVGYSSEEGLAADIMELGMNAGVDHIRNLRTIISGYIEYAYGYTREEADEIAVLVTVYNAVNRKNISRFTQNYQKSVAAKLDRDKVGLAVSFKEWPGKTQLVIPIYSPAEDDNFHISVEAIVEDENVKAALEKEDVKVDVERAVREQKTRGETAKLEAEAAKKRAEEESLARKQNARLAAEEADRKLKYTELSLAAAIERLRRETERLKNYEEEVITAQNEAAKARREVVRNKFGVPLAGNEAAMEKDAQLANQQSLVERQRSVVENAKNELDELEQKLEQARLDAAEAASYLLSID